MATMTPAAPSASWSMTARAPQFRPAPPARQGRLDGANLTPLMTTLVVGWVAICCVVQLLG